MPPQQYRLRTVTGRYGLSSLESDWRSLLRECRSTNVFTTFEWMSTWWNCHGEDKGLSIVVAEADGQVVAIVPLMIATRQIPFFRIPFKELRFLSTIHDAIYPESYLGTMDLIVSPDHERARERLVSEILTDLSGCNILRLHPIPVDSTTLTAFRKAAERTGTRISVQPCIENSYQATTGDWDTYFQSLSGKHRSNVRRVDRKFYSGSDITLETYSDPEEVDTALAKIRSIESRSWKTETGVPIDAEEFRGFYFELTKVAAAKGWLRISVLQTNGEPIAYQFNLAYKGFWVGLKSAYDVSHRDRSPGLYMMARLMKQLFEGDAKSMNMLWGGQQFKQLWCSELQVRSEVFHYRPDAYSRFIQALLTSQQMNKVWNRYQQGIKGLRDRGLLPGNRGSRSVESH